MSIFTPSRLIRQATLIIGLSLLTLILISATTSPVNGSSELKTHNSSLITHSMLFIQNVGQFPASTRFVVPGQHSRLELHDTGLTLVTADHEPLQLTFEQTNPAAELLPLDSLDTVVSYFQGDRNQWHTAVPTFNGVRYRNLYPQLDLVIQGQGDHWTWQFVCQGECQAALAQVKFSLNREFELETGNLTWAEGSLPLPTVVQPTGLPLPKPQQQGKTVLAPFAQAALSPRQQIHTPTQVTYKTYLGGSADDENQSIVLSRNGYIYITGDTTSSDFRQKGTKPFYGTFAPLNFNTTDGYLMKFDPTTNQVNYLLFFGGDNDDTVREMSIDNKGNVALTGYSYSATNVSGFPTTLPPSINSYAFVLRINPLGQVIFSTLVRQSWTTHSIASSAGGDSYVAGTATYVTPRIGNYSYDDGLYEYPLQVTKLSPAGGILYNVYIRIKGLSILPRKIVVDSDGYAYVVGSMCLYSGSVATIPNLASGFDPTWNNGVCNAFVLKITPSGNALVYFSLIGNGTGQGTGIIVDETGNTYVTGTTSDPNFLYQPPVSGGTKMKPFNATLRGASDTFLAKISPDGNTLHYLGFMGGGGNDILTPFALDKAQTLYLAGSTSSLDFPKAVNSHHGSTDGVIVKMKADASELIESVFIGGTGFEEVEGVLDIDSSVYLAGITTSPGLPVSAPIYASRYNGEKDSFLAQVTFAQDCPLVEIVSARYLDANTLGVVGFVQPELIGTGQATLTVGNLQADLAQLATHNAPSGAANAQNQASHDSSENSLAGFMVCGFTSKHGL